MSYTEWKDKTNEFKTIDVRGIQGNFFAGLKRQAMKIPAGEGLEVIQSFEPIPLYEVISLSQKQNKAAGSIGYVKCLLNCYVIESTKNFTSSTTDLEDGIWRI